MTMHVTWLTDSSGLRTHTHWCEDTYKKKSLFLSLRRFPVRLLALKHLESVQAHTRPSVQAELDLLMRLGFVGRPVIRDHIFSSAGLVLRASVSAARSEYIFHIRSHRTCTSKSLLGRQVRQGQFPPPIYREGERCVCMYTYVCIHTHRVV